jgi:predicted esterase
VNLHLGQPVLYAGRSLAEARAVAILVHGRNGTPQLMLELAARLQLPQLAYVAVSAAGNTWYPQSFLKALEENQPHLDDALQRLDALVHELQTEPRNLALVGFSQGACLASEYVHRRGGRWGALVAFTGGLIGPPGTSWAGGPPLLGTPVFLGTGDPDPFVPVARVRETAEVLRRQGAEVELREYPGRDHLVSDDEVARARRLLDALAGSSRG